MPKYRVARGCESVKMDDGTRYPVRGNVRSGGVVEIDNMAHAKAFEARGKPSNIVHTFIPITTSGTTDRVCIPCSFNAFKFQQVCPRCGRPTEEA